MHDVSTYMYACTQYIMHVLHTTKNIKARKHWSNQLAKFSPSIMHIFNPRRDPLGEVFFP